MNRFSLTSNCFLGIAAVLSATSIVVCSPLRAQAAAITTFTDAGAWKAEFNGNVFTEDFNVPTIENTDNFPDDSLTFPNLSFITADGNPDSAGARLRINNDRLRITIDNNPTNNRYDLVEVIFGKAVRGFGAEFFNVDQGLIISSESFDSDADVFQSLLTANPDNLGPGGIDGFFGIVSESPFTSFTFSSEGLNRFAVDDFAVDVPTPALLPGLVGMGMAALRKRKREEEVS